MRTFLIVNGGRKGPPPRPILDALSAAVAEAGAGSKVAVSSTLDEARRLVDEAAEGGFEALWMGGGDGTVHVLLNEAFGRGMALGVIPMGTVNALARSLGLPLRPVEAARRLVHARPVAVDAVQAGGRKFLCFASVGFDASVVHAVTGSFKRRWGRAAYAVAGLKAVVAGRGKLSPFTVEFGPAERTEGAGDDGGGASGNPADAIDLLDRPTFVAASQTGYSLIVSKILNYAGLPLFPAVRPDSGEMEMWLFRRNRPEMIAAWAAAGVAAELAGPLRGLLAGDVGHYLARSFTVRAERPLFLQLDGEAVASPCARDGGEECTVRFECLPRAVEVLVPPPHPQGVWD